jgi:hypothetical protein
MNREVDEKIRIEVDRLIENHVQSTALPTDREIARLSCLFYDRDKDITSPYDLEMMGVQRGIIQGMLLMRQIIEHNYTTK